MRAPLPHPPVSSITLLSLLSLAACSNSVRAPAKTSDVYRGPPLALDSTPPQQRVILTAPTGGWSFQLDQTRRGFDHTDIFLTITRPNPAYMRAQTPVRQEAGTEVDPSQPVVLYARVLSYDAKPGKQAYSPVPVASAPH